MANSVKVPMYMILTSTDPDLSSFYKVLETKFDKNKTGIGYERYEDVVHGFAGAGGNFSDRFIQGRVNQVVETLSKFFDRNLVKSENENSSGSRFTCDFIVFQILYFLILSQI